MRLVEEAVAECRLRTTMYVQNGRIFLGRVKICGLEHKTFHGLTFALRIATLRRPESDAA